MASRKPLILRRRHRRRLEGRTPSPSDRSTGLVFRQHFGEEGAVDVAAGLDGGDALAGEATAFLQRGGEGRGAGALGDVVGVAEHDPHRAAPRRMMSSASGSGTRTASPPAIVSAELVLTGLPAAKDSA